MDTLNEWLSPLIEMSILFACGALGGVGGMFGAGKTITVASMGDAIFRGGAVGAGAGLVANLRLVRQAAIAIAIWSGAGWIAREWIVDKFFSVVATSFGKDSDGRVPPKPHDP